MSTPQRTFRRGQLVRDTRTGQVVKIKEQGRGADLRVVPVYKSDGYWVGRGDLVAARDPHAWDWRHFTGFVLVLLAQGLLSWSTWHHTTGSPFDRLALTVLAGCASMGVMAKWAGLLRP